MKKIRIVVSKAFEVEMEVNQIDVHFLQNLVFQFSEGAE